MKNIFFTKFQKTSFSSGSGEYHGRNPHFVVVDPAQSISRNDTFHGVFRGREKDFRGHYAKQVFIQYRVILYI